MNEQLMSVLACPDDHHFPLEFNGSDEGSLTCPECLRVFQVRQGIPMLLSKEELLIEERWWALAPEPVAGRHFMRTDPNQLTAPIRIRTRDEAVLAGNSALDVGCATCIDYPLYRGTGLFYVGVDITYRLVAGALTYYPDTPVVQGDAKYLPFKSRSFDSVYCKDFLIHLPPGGYKKALEEMWRVADKKMMIQWWGSNIDIAKQCKHKKGNEGTDFNVYWSYYTKNQIMAVINNLPDFDGLTTEQVSWEGLPNEPSYRAFWVIHKK